MSRSFPLDSYCGRVERRGGFRPPVIDWLILIGLVAGVAGVVGFLIWCRF